MKHSDMATMRNFEVISDNVT